MISLELIGHFSPQLLETNRVFSFINFASIGNFFDHTPDTIAYFCDGMLMSTFMSRVTGRTIDRVSFDFTSIADSVFGCAEKQGKRVYFVGARQDELDLFVKKIKLLYPALIITGHHNGYFDATQAARIQADICLSEANILIVGLGAGLQEQFVLDALQIGFSGVAFTCGGFIHQEAITKHHYYPELINRLNFRAFYRMYREPRTIKRYVLDYPTNFVLLLIMIVRHKLTINVSAP
ncbi:WecB/TagA/CpsF family glycosyltransferase [Pseudomonas sp. ANT_J28]|uniref:WecB/TagA/CpsF family glycosyltransferase n=1 Tax=Pseudomonas sp. ANT_J28 TaxID=2597352 RepID=UPI0011F176A6|nr:WecB/TagA/CpsF family glycosyltransferase [Pseudomonas sp. ANT_J28]KAA0980647.1 WecB/TagA/CpsF family glycosyltransferase [Pseudomonas sp. ANT_J28]